MAFQCQHYMRQYILDVLEKLLMTCNECKRKYKETTNFVEKFTWLWSYNLIQAWISIKKNPWNRFWGFGWKSYDIPLKFRVLKSWRSVVEGSSNVEGFIILAINWLWYQAHDAIMTKKDISLWAFWLHECVMILLTICYLAYTGSPKNSPDKFIPEIFASKFWSQTLKGCMSV